jgi:hypothetical protein
MQHIFLEMVLLSLCSKKKTNNNDGSAPCSLAIAPQEIEEVDEDSEEDDDEEIEEDEEALSYEERWQNFVSKTESLNEPLVSSVFKQARFVSYASDSHRISIELSKDLILFKEWLDNSQRLWQPVLKDCFSAQTMLEAQFTGTQKINIVKKQKNDDISAATQQSSVIQPKQQQQKSPVSSSRPQEQFRPSNRYQAAKQNSVALNKKELLVDVSDENMWKKASMLMRHFPGVVTEIRENQ